MIDLFEIDYQKQLSARRAHKGRGQDERLASLSPEGLGLTETETCCSNCRAHEGRGQDERLASLSPEGLGLFLKLKQALSNLLNK